MKPVTKYICLSVSNRRARQEIVGLLREWKKYGARDIVVDKQRNIIFGRVAAKNCKSCLYHIFICGVWQC